MRLLKYASPPVAVYASFIQRWNEFENVTQSRSQRFRTVSDISQTASRRWQQQQQHAAIRYEAVLAELLVN
jgi:phage regulator Rha-like protein